MAKISKLVAVDHLCVYIECTNGRGVVMACSKAELAKPDVEPAADHLLNLEKQSSTISE
jgi:hypothetical protein